MSFYMNNKDVEVDGVAKTLDISNLSLSDTEVTTYPVYPKVLYPAREKGIPDYIAFMLCCEIHFMNVKLRFNDNRIHS